MRKEISDSNLTNSENNNNNNLLNSDSNLPNIPDTELKVESLPIKSISKDAVLKLSTVPEKRGPGRPKILGADGQPVNKTQPTQGRTQIGPAQTAQTVQTAPPVDHRFTITKIFTISEKMMQRRFAEIPESSKCITPDKDLENLSKDVNTGIAVIFPNSGAANKIVAAIGILISVSVYLADKYLLFKELQAKLVAKLSSGANPTNTNK